jgi:sterol desaturase/sphingolipid hydroxylase (fatty acid hydroxylase superfamily)
MSWFSVLEVFKLELFSNALRYVVVAGAFFLVFGVLDVRRHRRIQGRKPPGSRMRAEVLWSTSTVLIFALVGLVTTLAIRGGHTRVYLDVGQRGLAYLLLSMALMALFHDAYFYWTHRLLHHPALYARVHRVHHLSTTPSPWAAYSFHPLEAMVQAGIFPLIVFLVPGHPVALFLFLLYMIVRNVMGHLGVELFPPGFARHPLTGWHTTTTHHDIHHRFCHGNYGLYFSWWDEVMGTTHRAYAKAFDEVTSRPRARVWHVAAAVLLAGGLVARADAGTTPEDLWQLGRGLGPLQERSELIPHCGGD